MVKVFVLVESDRRAILRHGDQVRTVEVPVAVVIAHDDEVALRKIRVSDTQGVRVRDIIGVESQAVVPAADAIGVASGSELAAWNSRALR